MTRLIKALSRLRLVLISYDIMTIRNNMLLEDSHRMARVLNITLPLQIVVYLAAAALFYAWRNLDDLIYTSQVAVLQLLVVGFFSLGCFNALLLLYGTREAPRKQQFLNLYRVVLVGLIILLIALAKPLDHWIALHAGIGTNMPFIRF